MSRAFRIPTYTDLYYSDPANVGNPNLRPDRRGITKAGSTGTPVDVFRFQLPDFIAASTTASTM